MWTDINALQVMFDEILKMYSTQQCSLLEHAVVFETAVRENLWFIIPKYMGKTRLGST
jgi:hypothetical protein